jgi:hypothetical protein
MGRCSMPTRCFEALPSAAWLSIMAAAPAVTRADESCATRLPCSEEAFIERLLKAARETRLSGLPHASSAGGARTCAGSILLTYRQGT